MRTLRERLGLVDSPPAAAREDVGQREVVAEPRIHLDVVRPPQRGDRPVSARDRADPGLRRANEQLVAPVDPFLVPALVGLEHDFSADVRDLVVGEVADEAPERIGRPGRVRVRKGDDLAARPTHGQVLRRHLAAAGAAQ